MRDIKVYCMMCSMEKGMDQYTSDLILVNAYDMWQEKRRHQILKNSRCDGVMRSNLVPVNHLGTPVVMFDVLLSNSLWEANEIKCYVRVDDLEVPPNLSFVELNSNFLPPFNLKIKDNE